MKKNYLMIGLLAFLSLWLTACTTEEESALDGIVNPDDPMLDISNDVLKGKIFLYANLSDLQKRGNTGQILDTREPVELIVHNDYGLPLYLEERGGLQYVRAGITNATVKERIVIPAYVKGKESGEIRNMIFIIKNDAAKDNLEGEDNSIDNSIVENNTECDPRLLGMYKTFLGKGTKCDMNLGTTLSPVLLADELFKSTRDGLIVVNPQITETTLTEIEESSFSSLMTSFSTSVGLGGKINGFKGGFSYGFSDVAKTSKNQEYYMMNYMVKRAEMRLVTADLKEMTTSNERTAAEFLSFVAEGFNQKVIETPNAQLSPETIYDNYGTDIITQGTFGGIYSTIFSREENIYEHSIKHDFSAYVKHKEKEDPVGSDWFKEILNALKEKDDDLKADVSVSYQQDDYFRSTKATKDVFSRGGSVSINDPKEWVKAFNDIDDCDKWALIQYKTKSDGNNDEWLLYSIDKMAEDVVNAVEKIFTSYKKMSDADMKVIANARANIVNVEAYRQAYLEQKIVKDQPKSPLVICDVKMINSTDRRKNGQPTPFTDKDPLSGAKCRTYYPMITNPFFDPKQGEKEMRGKPVDTNDNVFISSGHTTSHYWYVAFAHADDCNGITDIKFCTQEEAPGRYSRRGDHARNGLSGMLVKKRYVYVHFGSEPGKRKPEQLDSLITAFGLYDPHSDYGVRYKHESEKNINIRRIFASSFGADLPLVQTDTEWDNFFNFWGHGYTIGDIKDKKKTKKFYEGGGAVTPHSFYPVYSTHPIDSLPKNRIFTKWE